MRKELNNILVVRNDRFGEFLLNIPAMRALKESFPHAKLIAVVDPAVAELAKYVPYIDESIAWGRQRHSLREKIELIGILRRKKLGMALMLNPSKEFNLISFFAGIPVRAGYNRKCGFLLTRKIRDLKHLALKHEVEYNLELAGLVGAKTDDLTLTLEINDDIMTKILPQLSLPLDQPLIALHPWSSDPVKLWPKANFLQLSKRLAEEFDFRIVIIGGKENLTESRKLFGAAGERVINLTGMTTLVQLAALLKKCRLLISGDSGPVHLASAVGTPVIALFRNDLGGKTPVRWGPWGKNATVAAKPKLSEITTEEVFLKTKEVLQR